MKTNQFKHSITKRIPFKNGNKVHHWEEWEFAKYKDVFIAMEWADSCDPPHIVSMSVFNENFKPCEKWPDELFDMLDEYDRPNDWTENQPMSEKDYIVMNTARANFKKL